MCHCNMKYRHSVTNLARKVAAFCAFKAARILGKIYYSLAVFYRYPQNITALETGAGRLLDLHINGMLFLPDFNRHFMFRRI